MTYDLDATTLLYQVQDVLSQEASPSDKHFLLERVLKAKTELGPVSEQRETLPVWSTLTCCAAELLLQSNRHKVALKILQKETEPEGVLYDDVRAQVLRSFAENKLGRPQEVVKRLAPLMESDKAFQQDPQVGEVVGQAYADLKIPHLAYNVLSPFVQEGEALCLEKGPQRIVSWAMLSVGNLKKHQEHFGPLLVEQGPFLRGQPASD